MCSYSTAISTTSSSTSCSSSISSDQQQQQSKDGQSTPSTSGTGSCSSSPAALATYPLIPREQLEVQEQLGVGSYGAVFKGLWERPNGQTLPVALKKVFMLEKEVEILSQIRHRNIIQFYGVSRANKMTTDFFIVTEYAERGSLYEHLHDTNEQISLERTIKWAIQIARGVAYLHYEAPITIIHRDLKSKNVVINKKFQCKLCDFGTSKDLTHSWTVPSWGGTAAWMSPEIISQQEGITTATDVWSFAVVLWEMFSREIPYKSLTEFKIYSIISQHGVRLVIPETCPEPLAELLKSCWRQNPKERPDMRCVLSTLERLNEDKFLRQECATFLNQNKAEWRECIYEQLRELDVLKLDLARQIEDLRRREVALRKRENSHRNFLHMVDILNVENVCEWNEDCVCEWVQNIAAAAVADFPEETVDTIISCVLQYGINGPRLLKITEKDLESLGIEPVALRRYVGLKLDELRAMNVRLCNFQCCPDSPPCSCGPSPPTPNTKEPPIECSIVLHVGLYSRMVLSGPACRFKVFLDSDWEQPNGFDIPSQLQDSATIIKEVNISMIAADRTNFLGPVQCICPPFGYLEWAQLTREQQQHKLPLKLTLHITYTDQVIQPRNTRIQIRLDDLAAGPRTLCNKRVPLKICGAPTDTSLSRISTSLQRSPLKSLPSVATAPAVCRRRSFGYSGSLSPERRQSLISGSSTNLLNRSPVWADMSANIRNRNATCAFRPVSKSIGSEHRAAANTKQALHRSTSSGCGDCNKNNSDEYVKVNVVDPVQMARKKALLKVRQRVDKKKCFSETELSRHSCNENLNDFYLATPNNQSSRSSISSVSEQQPTGGGAEQRIPLREEKLSEKWSSARRRCGTGPPSGLSLIVPAAKDLLQMAAETSAKIEASRSVLCPIIGKTVGQQYSSAATTIQNQSRVQKTSSLLKSTRKHCDIVEDLTLRCGHRNNTSKGLAINQEC